MKKLTILLLLMLILPVAAINQYVAVPQDISDGKGIMEIKTLCHHSLFSQEILVKNTTENWSDARQIYLQPDGLFNDRFAPGTYDLKLIDGNGGQPEYRSAEITEGYLTLVVFIGHATSGHGEPIIPTPTPSIKPRVSGSCTPRTGNLPITVTCTDKSTNNPTNWSWRFVGYGGVFTANTPTWTFTIPYTVSGRVDTYDMNLIVSNDAGTSDMHNQHGYASYYNNPSPTPTPTPTQILCDVWHEGYFTYDLSWSCRNETNELSLMCCRWVIVPVWHEGYWEIC